MNSWRKAPGSHSQGPPPVHLSTSADEAAARTGLPPCQTARPARSTIPSVPGIGAAAHSCSRLFVPARNWQLWSLAPGAIGWMLLAEAVAVLIAITRTVGGGWPSAHAWLLFASLAVCASLHLVLTRPAEERRRAAHLKVEHIDQTSIWLFAGALVVPMSLLVGLVAVVRIQRYLIARKPPCRFVFTSAAIMLSATAVQLIAQVTPVSAWLASTPPSPWTPDQMVLVGGALLAAMAAYFAVQTIVIGVARGLSTGHWTWQALAGSRADNVLLMQAMCLGLLASLAVAFTMALLVVVVPVAIQVTRTLQRIQQLEFEQRQLESDAEHDPLTGLFNRRGFDPRAQLALVSTTSAGQSSAVVMFDVDHFTGWNSRLGHLGADVLLRAITDTISSSVRGSDLIGRWGGEELALLLPNTGRDEAVEIINRIRVRVAELRVDITTPAGGRPRTTNTDELPGCTISAGIAIAPEHGVGLQELQEVADQAVYQAKRLGRNRVEIAAPATEIPQQRVDSPPPRHSRSRGSSQLGRAAH